MRMCVCAWVWVGVLGKLVEAAEEKGLVIPVLCALERRRG